MPCVVLSISLALMIFCLLKGERFTLPFSNIAEEHFHTAAVLVAEKHLHTVTVLCTAGEQPR